MHVALSYVPTSGESMRKYFKMRWKITNFNEKHYDAVKQEMQSGSVVSQGLFQNKNLQMLLSLLIDHIGKNELPQCKFNIPDSPYASVL